MIFVKNKKTKHSDLPDQELVKAILQASGRDSIRPLQEELYARYAEKVYAKCVYMVKRKELAKDLSHDVMVKIFMSLNKFRGEASLYSWIYSITYNHCLNHIAKEKRLKLEDFETHSYEMATDKIELENKILKDLKLTQLEKLIGLIDEKERAVLLMRYQDGMAVKEIAKILDIGISAVKMRLKRSRDHLAELLKELDHDV